MAAQLARLVEVSALDSVTLRVLPLTAVVGEHYVPHSSFSHYRFVDPDDPDLVVLETLTSDLHLIDAEDVAPYTLTYEWLTEAALSPQESVTFLAGLARRL